MSITQAVAQQRTALKPRDRHTPALQRHAVFPGDEIAALHRAASTADQFSPTDGALLQRAIGNHAVGELLARPQSPHARTPLVQNPLHAIVQRVFAPGGNGERRSNAAEPLALPTYNGHDASRAQRSAIKEAVPVIQPAIGATHAGSLIQRKGTHFWQYLNSQVPGLNPTQRSDSDMLIASWLLDQNIYELMALLSGSAEPEFENLSKLTGKGLSVNDVAAYLKRHNAPPADNEEKLMAFLSQFVAQAPANLTTAISSRAQATTGQFASRIRWFGLTPWGAGTGVELHMLPGGLPKGSPPASDPVWMKTVEQHHPSTNNTTMYVRGHLLNDNIGGPGLDYNMVPITGKPAKNVGGNDANAEHLRAIETKAKDTWSEVRANKLREAMYRVVPEYKRTSRPESAFVRQQATKLRQILDSAVQSISTHYSNLPSAQLQQEFQKLQTQFPLNLHGGAIGPTPQEQASMLAIRDTKNFEQTTLGALSAANHPIAAAILSQVDMGVLNASAEGNALNMPLAELLLRVMGNAETWEAEDRYIPTNLHVALHTVDTSGTVASLTPPPIPITLSTDTANVFFRPKKKGEDA